MKPMSISLLKIFQGKKKLGYQIMYQNDNSHILQNATQFNLGVNEKPPYIPLD